jgi:hypothetical protein
VRFPAPHKPLKRFRISKNKFSGGTMELHPFISLLDKKDLERYLNSCKNDLWNYLENLGLSDTLTLQVLEEVRAALLINDTFLSLKPSDISISYQTSNERLN